VKALSVDHKPHDKIEYARITTAGGYVQKGRIDEHLNLSRALGVFQFKQNTSLKPEDQIITANPDVTVHDITEEDEFLVLACDGTLRNITSCSCSYILYQGI